MRFNNLREWAVGQKILAADLQNMTDRLNAVTPLSITGNVVVKGGFKEGMAVYIPPQPIAVSGEIRRVQVNTANVSGGPPYVQLVKGVNEDTGALTGNEYPAVTSESKAVGDELYIFKPVNGLKSEDAATYDGDDVVWRELAGSGGSAVKRFKVTAAGLATCGAKTWDGTTLGDTEVTILNVMGHGVDDILYAAESANGTETVANWVEILHLDPTTNRYMTAQVVDTVGRLGLDYVRAHA